MSGQDKDESNRLVPFSQPQGNMNMNMRTRPVTRRTTTTPRTTTVRRTTLQELATTTSRPDLRERIAEEGNLISRNIFKVRRNFCHFPH